LTETIQEIGTAAQDGSTISIAVEGCCHGSLDPIYDRLQNHQVRTGRPIDLFVCCGDFQSLRSPADFHSIAVPPKYREMGTFYQYYSGAKVAPILTIFIGGNHEASQPLQELYYGGWVAKNIYYLGAAGVVNYKGIRIGGISGIYKSHDHTQSRFEIPPFDQKTLRSVYHYRNVETYRLKCLNTKERKRMDIMLSHDWPQGIEQHGDTEGLIRRKPFFRQEIAENSLGSPPAHELLQTLQPYYWFSAHLHVKFQATVRHGDTDRSAAGAPVASASLLVPSQAIKKSKQNAVDGEAATKASNDGDKKVESKETQFVVPESSGRHPDGQPDLTDLMTQFLSLDKCLPRRQYLSIVNVPIDPNAPDKLQYDVEWLAILRRSHHLSAADRKHRVHPPAQLEHATDAEMDWVRNRLGSDTVIPENFQVTAPTYVEPPPDQRTLPPPLPRMGNPQTDRLLEILELDHIPNLTIPYNSATNNSATTATRNLDANVEDENEIVLDYDGEADEVAPVADKNEDDIDIDDDDDEGEGSPDDKPPDDKRPRLET